MRAHLATSLYDAKCHEGFHCVSAVDVFGRRHDGKYTGLPVGVITPVRYRGAYEAGCPARGLITNAGDCRDPGKGPVNFCWSNDRYEAGPSSPCKDPSMCMCVKDGTNGTGNEHPYQSKQNQMGSELETRTYLVQPEAQCEDCAAHNCFRIQCNKCKNCEYGTKTIMGRTAKGCYFRDFGMSRAKRIKSKEGRGYLFAGMEGQESQEQEQKLVVIPHYKLWDPGDTRTPGEAGGKPDHPAHELLFPYESRREPLSRETWIDAYKDAAPRIQRELDKLVENVKEWGPKANLINCTEDILGRIQKVKVFRRECMKHQAIIANLAPASPFENDVPNGAGAFTPVNCHKGGQGMCQYLNCYSDDIDLMKGIDQLREREKTCRKALGLLVKEEELNGPIGEEAEVSAASGGRLEVPLPSPKEGGNVQGSMIPIDAGFAFITVAGIVASAKHNYVKTAGLLSRGENQAGHGTRSAQAFHDFLCRVA